MSVSFCLPHPVAVSAFMMCRGLCACTEMLFLYIIKHLFAKLAQKLSYVLLNIIVILT